MTRTTIVFIVTILSYAVHQNCGHDSQLLLHSYHNMAMVRHCYRNNSTNIMEKCLQQCLVNCSCLSFQVCGKDCQLCNSSQYVHPKDMRRVDGCTLTTFHDQEIDNNQCNSNTGCLTGINCCFTSNPCQNGGTCYPLNINSKRRFTCKCPNKFQGDRCEQMICKPGYQGNMCNQPIRSCRGYADGNRLPGRYIILTENNSPFEVFCDFSNKSSMTWTLVQSYQLASRTETYVKAFYSNQNYNNNDPSWANYRLSKNRMISIQQDSVKWRVTCLYDTERVVYRDYMQGSNIDLNILTFNGDGCVKFEYIDIRGYNCNDCTGHVYQNDDCLLHFDSWVAGSKSCDLKPGDSIQICHGSQFNGEDNFGCYDCTNPEHRCSSSPQATTQTWFGG